MMDADPTLSSSPTLPSAPRSVSAPPPADPVVTLLGVPIANVTRGRALAIVEELIRSYDGRPRSVLFANAHTLNLAATRPDYLGVLNSADYVFGDGTGARWAARLKGVRLKENVNGTDLVPVLFEATAGRGYRYFLLGAEPETIEAAARAAEARFRGWSQAGFHHGYLDDPQTLAEVIERVNRARPHLLLVGMGNPRQEEWIARYRHRLGVPVCMGVGGLFDFWAGKFRRAPAWIRRAGHEWVWRLLEDPRDKARRYLLGNPLFLARAIRDALRQRGGGAP
jgi:N-acetylglucosaminyldiphosphoundecaprenol N-acetyl-beta-D-mannosaminyltransferase